MVTLDGARRISYQLGLEHQFDPVDIEFVESLHRQDLNGLIVVPPLIQQWKSGDIRKDSDIEDINGADSKPGSGPSIVQSIRASFLDRTFNESGVHWVDRTDLIE